MTKKENKRARNPKGMQKLGGLLLEDGSFWPGFSFGALATGLGECVFHTAHSGYQEILTDPSYRKQHLIFSAPQIGNQGIDSVDFESERIWASGCIVREYSDAPYHWRREKTLDDVLKEQKVPGLSGVDTRRLILHLRKAGSLWGVLSTESSDPKKLKEVFKNKMSMEGLSLTQEVSTSNVYIWKEGSRHLMNSCVPFTNSNLKRCIVMDFGVKRQILRYLVDAGFEEVVVVPAHTKASEIRDLKPDAILLSNGPGDPAADPAIVSEVKSLLGDFPILGICLGHQILGLALGLKTFKLKFGHHGANHPVKNVKTDRVEITSQNHGFAVEADSHPDLEMTHLNLNDQTLEGFVHKKLPICGIQFHPESSPGPLDSTNIFCQLKTGVFL